MSLNKPKVSGTTPKINNKSKLIGLSEIKNNSNKSNPIVIGFLILILLGIIGGAVWYFKFRDTPGKKCKPDNPNPTVNYTYDKDLECVGDKKTGESCIPSGNIIANAAYTYNPNIECIANCLPGYNFNEDNTMCLNNSEKFYELVHDTNPTYDTTSQKHKVGSDNIENLKNFMKTTYTSEYAPGGFKPIILIDDLISSLGDDIASYTECKGTENLSILPSELIIGNSSLKNSDFISSKSTIYGSDLGILSLEDCAATCSSNTLCTGYHYDGVEIDGITAPGVESGGNMVAGRMGTCYLKKGGSGEAIRWDNNHNPSKCYSNK